MCFFRGDWWRGENRRRDHPFNQIVEASEVAAGGCGDPTAPKKKIQSSLTIGPSPPSPNSPRSFFGQVARDFPRSHRSMFLYDLENLFDKFLVGLREPGDSDPG